MKAVIAVVQYMERELCYARKKEGGVENKVLTKELITALFAEFSNRNGEPHLHTHTGHASATRDGEKWRSLLSDGFSNKGVVKFLGKVYRNELAQNVQKLGYNIRAYGSEGFFEIDGANKEVIKFFPQEERILLSG